MGRPTPGHFDDVFLNKIKQVCIHVLDQLNEANEIDQAFDLCPSISRRNRAILSFLHDADQANAASSPFAANVATTSSPSERHVTLGPNHLLRLSREPSLGTDSVASLSAQRRRRAREMQYVRDPNDSNDDSDSQATVAGPSTSFEGHLDPASARNPHMSQPDYTFEQFADHLDPTDKLLKRSFEIIIKETARHALAKKRDPNYDPTSSSGRSSVDPAASLRSAIASSRGSARHRYGSRPSTWSRLQSSAIDWSVPDDADQTAANLDHTYQLLRSLRPSSHPPNNDSGTRSHFSNPSDNSTREARRTLRDLLLSSSQGRLSSDSSTSRDLMHSSSRIAQPSNSVPSLATRSSRLFPSRGSQPSSLSPDTLAPRLTTRRSAPRPDSAFDTSQLAISETLARAARRNADAARTISETERLRSSQFIRASIESLRASLFQLHMDLACTQLQQDDRGLTLQARESTAASSTTRPDLGASYALVMDTIELFDDTLRRLSCLITNTGLETNRDAVSSTQPTNTQRNADSSQMRASLWRARNLMLLSSMSRRANQAESALNAGDTPSAPPRDAELRAHRHLLATIEESHWSRTDIEAPSTESIRAWRRKLTAWYRLDRDRSQYPDAPESNGDHDETYARWHPDLELPYALDDEIMAPMSTDAASPRPDPIADPQAAWVYARRHDVTLSGDLNTDNDIRAALHSASVAAALQQLLRAHNEEPGSNPVIASTGEQPAGRANEASASEAAHPADAIVEDADPDVSLARTTSLRRRNAVRGMQLNNSDTSSIRSARSSLSLRRARDPVSAPAAEEIQLETTHDDNDAVDEEIVETSMEIGTVPHSPELAAANVANSSALLPPSDHPRAGRSGSFTFITTPAAVLRSRQRSQNRSQGGRRSQSPAANPEEERDSEAEEYIDLDLDLGMAGQDAFDFDLVDFLRTESRRAARGNEGGDDGAYDFTDTSPPPRLRRGRAQNADGDHSQDESTSASPTNIRVYVSGSGASTPAEARQATFEAYAQRARLIERRRRMERQRQELEGEDLEMADGGNGSQEHSPEGRRRRRGRHIGDTGTTADDAETRRNSLPFPRGSER